MPIKSEEIQIIDDNHDDSDLVPSNTEKSLEAMWHKIKHDVEEPDWQSNLGSIRETPSEEPSSPFPFTKTDDDDLGLQMKFLPRTESIDETKAANVSSSDAKKGDESPSVDAPKPRGRLGSRTLSEENVVLDVGKDALSNVQNFHERISQATSSFVSAITTPFWPSSSESETKRGNTIPTAPDDEFVFEVPKNHYLSPYWASDEVLRQFPKTKILSTIVDPCLDDCVEFGKKLKHLNVDIHVDVLEGLNHGFLNFAQVIENCFIIV